MASSSSASSRWSMAPRNGSRCSNNRSIVTGSTFTNTPTSHPSVPPTSHEDTITPPNYNNHATSTVSSLDFIDSENNDVSTNGTSTISGGSRAPSPAPYYGDHNTYYLQHSPQFAHENTQYQLNLVMDEDHTSIEIEYEHMNGLVQYTSQEQVHHRSTSTFIALPPNTQHTYQGSTSAGTTPLSIDTTGVTEFYPTQYTNGEGFSHYNSDYPPSTPPRQTSTYPDREDGRENQAISPSTHTWQCERSREERIRLGLFSWEDEQDREEME